MNKIEQIEKIYDEWKAKAEKSIEHKFVEKANTQAHVCYELALALSIIREPSNIQMHVDAKKWKCSACYTNNTNLREFCRVCSAPRQ